MGSGSDSRSQHGTTQEGSTIILTASYFLRDHHNPSFHLDILEHRLWDLKISELARIWFLMHRQGNESDANAEILAPYEGTDAWIKDLLPEPGALRFKHTNPVVIAALDERIRRAAAMIIEDAVYEAYLSETQNLYLPINDPGAAPSGKTRSRRPSKTP